MLIVPSGFSVPFEISRATVSFGRGRVSTGSVGDVGTKNVFSSIGSISARDFRTPLTM